MSDTVDAELRKLGTTKGAVQTTDTVHFKFGMDTYTTSVVQQQYIAKKIQRVPSEGQVGIQLLDTTRRAQVAYVICASKDSSKFLCRRLDNDGNPTCIINILIPLKPRVFKSILLIEPSLEESKRQLTLQVPPTGFVFRITRSRILPLQRALLSRAERMLAKLEESYLQLTGELKFEIKSEAISVHCSRLRFSVKTANDLSSLR